jgi:hypothetical protein
MRIKIITVAILILVSCSQEPQGERENEHISISTLPDDSLIHEKKEVSTVKNYLCQCFLLDSGTVSLYDLKTGKVSDSISNDYENEDFYVLEIREKRNHYFRVAANSIENKNIGWVKSDDISRMGVYPANYTGELIIYENPNQEGDTIHIFEEYFIEPMKVLDCDQKWVKVAVEMEEKTYIGWVLQSKTCSNPYSTCN